MFNWFCNLLKKKIKYDENIPLLNFDFENKELDVLVKSVYDGDTITVIIPIELNIYSFNKNKTITIKKSNNKDKNIQFYSVKVRLYGIDTPELKPPLITHNRDEIIKKAKEAKYYLQNIINDKIIKIKFHKNEKYGRAMGTLYLNNININQQMIDSKYAVPYFGGKK
jgi:endonuclease YncB( thermonuclease family)